MFLISWLSFFFFPLVFSFSSLGPGNCKKRIALESIIVADINLVYEQILSLGIFCFAIPGYLVNGAVWCDLCSSDP